MAFPGDLSGFPFFPLQFNNNAQAVDPGEEPALRGWLQAQGPVDLAVVSHGWNNDEQDALRLYQNLFACVRKVLNQAQVPAMNGRTIAVAGVFWPSKKFAAEEDIPGGAASVTPADPLADAFEGASAAADPQVLARLRELAAEEQPTLPQQDEAVTLLRKLLAAVPDSAEEGASSVRSAAAGDGGFTNDVFLQQLLGEEDAPEAGEGGAAGLFPGPADDLVNAVQMGLNLFTFYTMRERAGQVGAQALNPLLTRLAALPNVRLHLMGHSFGARLVTSAAAASGLFRPRSMALLQAAFSHYGFATLYDGHSDGAFRNMLMEKRVAGPIIITHTSKDRAVGWAYPIAARLRGIVAAAIDGGPDDPFGGMGRNGAQKTPQAVFQSLLAAGAPGYRMPASGGVLNLEASAFISGHSAITNDAVAFALLNAMV